MIISIASGKGGTGKTTVATNLAVSLHADVQLLDCDVEEPNSHLFIRPDIKGVETIYTPVPEVDMNKCSLCGKCSEICQFKAIVVLGDIVPALSRALPQLPRLRAGLPGKGHY